MQIEQFLSPNCTLASVPGGSKKRLFETISDFAAKIYPETDAEDIFDRLIERERLGSTGLGDGVAIPHCRLGNCDHIIGILMSLQQAVDFDAIDRKPVDLIFALLVPEQANDDHLLALQAIAERFSQPQYCEALRHALTDEELYLAATRG